MATQVEVGSSLPSLTTRSELTNEAKLQRVFGSSLSDASHKPSGLPSSLSPLILEERNRFGSPLRPATMPPVASRPRLTPKPFSRGMSSDTFAVVKPPVPAFRPSNVAPNPPAFAKTFEDERAAKGLNGNVPPLVDQKLIEDKSPSELVANMPFDSSPQANTVILFETGKSEKVRMTVTPEKRSLDSPQIRSTLQTTPEGHLSPLKSEVFCRTAGLHRQLSLSSESRAVSWNPSVYLEGKDNFAGAPEEKEKAMERQHSTADSSPAHEVLLRPKQRPVSAIFLESLKDPKQYCSEVVGEQPPLEKAWVRKPRPLSMDLTAKFENRDLSLQKKSGPAESKEKSLGPDPTKQGSVRPSERWTRNEAVASERADSSKSSLKSPSLLVDSASVLNQKPFPSEEASSGQSAQRDLPQVFARDRKCPWESRLKQHSEQNAGETEAETTLEKATEPFGVRGPSVKDRAALSPKEPCAARKNCAYGSDAGRQLSRGVENPTNGPNRPAHDSPSVNVESQPETPGEENRIMNIQQRIKELTAENADTKTGNLRRSFRSRPLSADLTKLFSSPATGSKLNPEKLAELNRKPVNQAQEIQEIKINPLHGTDPGESHAGGMMWRSEQPVKILHVQTDGGFAREKPDGAVRGGRSASVADDDARAKSTPSAEKACVKTVRATLFEHHVQRHKVAAEDLGAPPPSYLTDELSGNCRTGKAAGPKAPPKEVPWRPLDVMVGAENHREAASLNEDRVLQDASWKKPTAREKCDNPTPKHVVDSLACQRIEPRYEILQTVGKRAQSEAVAMICEDKAVTLRSRRSLKERRKLGESLVDASWSRSLDLKDDCWKEAGFNSKTKEAQEAPSKTDALPASRTSQGLQASCEPGTEVDKNQFGQKPVTGKASYITIRNKDLSTTGDRGSVISSQQEKELSKSKMERSQVQNRLPENVGAGPGRTDDGVVGAHGSPRTTSSYTSKPESLRCGSRGSQGQAVPHQSADMKTCEQKEPKGFGLRKYPPAHRAQEPLDAAGHSPQENLLQPPEVEEQVKRSSRRVSAGKGPERWRRKTLPHGMRFEGVGTPAEEGATVLIRRDSLQLHEGLMAKKGRKPRCAVELKEGAPVSPSSPEDRFENQHSPSKPPGANFAAVCQGPNEAGGDSGKEVAHKSKRISSLVETTLFASNAGPARRSHPLSDHQICAALSDMPGSLDARPGKSWEEAGEGDESGLWKKGPVKCPASEGRDGSWRSLERQVEGAQGRILGVDPALASSPSERKSPSYLRHSYPEGEHVDQRKHSDLGCSVPRERTTDSYRSRVLDIDALMAEYKGDSLKPAVTQDRRKGEDSNLFPREKYKRSSSDKTSLSHNQKDPQVLGESPGSRGQDAYSREVRRPKERWGSCSREPSSSKGRDQELSPPPWGRPSALGLPANAAGSKKKTFILDEEPGAGLLLWSPGAGYGEPEVHIPGPLCVGLKAEAGVSPLPSSALADGVSQKGPCPKQQGTKMSPEGDWHHRSSLSKRKSGGAGSPRKSSSSAAQSPAEWDAPTLAKPWPDSTCSCSEKNHAAQARDVLPTGPEPRGRREQHRVRQSLPPEQADRVRQSRRSVSQQRSLFCEERKDLEKERSRPDQESPAARSSPRPALQRRSRSFHRDRRVDHWAMDQLKQCFGRPAAEAKDTDTLVREADSQYGTWSEQRHSGESLVPESPSPESNVASARKQPPSSRLSSFSSQADPASAADLNDSSRDQRSASLDRSSTDVDSADGTEGPAPAGACPDFAFVEQTAVLDSSILKTRVQLSKRRRQHRAPISHVLRRSSGGVTEQQPPTTEETGSDWMFKDSTEKATKPEGPDTEGKPHSPSERLPSSQPQRLPVFPGLDHSALKVQLRRRQEPEGTGEASPGQLSKSPKSVFPAGSPGVRVLPVGTEKEERPEEASPSPQWLKELKSKKRQSQYENQV
ncbi:uncharacterized protein KIAA1671 homolog [Sphaerodactylus townsendi]|uniref:uncharacterized protein KIAA1671 homolog n=1 Tax=Sphaerodactylus townsendi TaxID=933632 RepID=UPI002027040B|nr:uncharacterized protein KIAA1671 homolog [Sphaerodactylus townsendi]XP_048370840.1 uncharacterized protein KIAA1671 homolog [Sphaerodactylus townsendi]